MFNFIKKAAVPGVGSDKEEKEKRKRDKKDRKEKQKRERTEMSTEELMRLELRRSLKIRGRRKDKEKLPSGITADYTADFLASLDDHRPPALEDPSEGGWVVGGRPPLHRQPPHDGQPQSDSSEASLNSLQAQGRAPPVPPKRGILKAPRVSVFTADGVGEGDVGRQHRGQDVVDCLATNTLQNELIGYQNLPPAARNGCASINGGGSGRDVGAQLLVITSPSADSLTDTTNSSFATPPFSLSPVGESQGFHRWSRTANFDDVRLPLPPAAPHSPASRTVAVRRQGPPPRRDFGFSLRRAVALERSGGGVRAVVLAEPGVATAATQRDETGLLPGDRLLEVNGVPVEGRTREEVIEMVRASGESVTLKVQPVAELSELSRRCGHDGTEVHLDDANIRAGTLKRSGSRRFNKTATNAQYWDEYLKYIRNKKKPLKEREALFKAQTSALKQPSYEIKMIVWRS